MDKRLQDLVDWTKEKLKLDSYFLKTSSIQRKVNTYQETVYTLCMEWFPLLKPDYEDEDLNPEGTAVVEIDLHSKQIQSIIFVGEKTFADLRVEAPDTNAIVEWIEQETNISSNLFHLAKEEANRWLFVSSIDGIAISPSGQIEVKLDQEGRLLLFAVHGEFPSEHLVEVESFTLTQESVIELAYKQIDIIKFPVMEEEKWKQAYAMEEVFVTNKEQQTLNFDIGIPEALRTKIKHLLTWKSGLDNDIVRKKIDVNREISADTAYANEPSPDMLSITKEEQEKCFETVKNFMRKVYPNDSGKWVLDHLYRDMEMVHAVLKLNEQNKLIFNEKLVVMLDPKTFEVLNYIDTSSFLEMFQNFESEDKVMVGKEEAFGNLEQHLLIKPYYVYDYAKQKYVLCGKLDCHYCVDAESGEVILLDAFTK